MRKVRRMEPLVDVVIEDNRWEALGLSDLALVAVRATLAALSLPETGLTLCLMGCDDTRIATLNAEFRGKPTPTNVLSWPAWDLSAEAEGEAPDAPEIGTEQDPESLGDVALAYETCLREAAEAGKPAADHVTHLIVHGLLHLLGHDHIREADAARMEALEVQILATLGLSDPYA
jgi:probable rRNA maturation factor